MKRSALILALALTLPLTLYGIPYAYASTVSSTYGVTSSFSVPANTIEVGPLVSCNSGDYATGGGFSGHYLVHFPMSAPRKGGSSVSTGDRPDGWEFAEYNSDTQNAHTVSVWVICQTPITVAGVTVPEFGSLYVAIALGALVYSFMARRFVSTPKMGATPG